MKKLIFDTSIWVEFFRKNETQSSQLLHKYIQNNLDLCLCPPIYQEIVQGSKNPTKIIELLDSLNLLQLDPYFVAKEAGLIFQNLRKKGITIRSPNDCSIAFYAIHFNIELVHNDVDFDQIAAIIPLPIFSKM